MTTINFFYKNIILSAVGLTFYSVGYSQVQVPKTATQGLRCEYILTYKTDSTSSISKKELFTLSLADGLSLFKSSASNSMDSLAAAYDIHPFNEQNAQLMMQAYTKLPKPAFSYLVYKKPAERSVMFYEKVGKTLYAYKEEADLLNWVVVREMSIINGYKCQKATTALGGRKFEAWFTRDIPIADGPYKFYGLPGLIVEVHDNHQYYNFRLVKTTSVPSLLVPSRPKQSATTTTKQRFFQGKATYDAGALGRVEAMGNTFTDAEKQAYRERTKRRNNPLELR